MTHRTSSVCSTSHGGRNSLSLGPRNSISRNSEDCTSCSGYVDLPAEVLLSYRLEAAEPLPLVDLLFSPASVVLSPWYMDRFLGFLRKHYSKLDWLHRLGMLLHVVVFVVPQRVGQVLAVVNFVLCVPLLVCAFLLMSNEVLLLLARRYEFWFFASVNALYFATFALLLGDLRVFCLASHALEIHAFICMDANFRTMASFLRLDLVNVALLLSVMALLYLRRSDVQWDTPYFSWQITRFFRVEVVNIVLNCAFILVILLLRKTYSRKRLHDAQGNATRIVKCVFCRCKMMVFNRREPLPKSIRANNFQRSKRVYQNRRISSSVAPAPSPPSAPAMSMREGSSKTLLYQANHRFSSMASSQEGTHRGSILALASSIIPSVSIQSGKDTSLASNFSSRATVWSRTTLSGASERESKVNRITTVALTAFRPARLTTDRQDESTNKAVLMPATSPRSINSDASSVTAQTTHRSSTPSLTAARLARLQEKVHRSSLETSIPYPSPTLVRSGSGELLASRRTSAETSTSTPHRGSNITLMVREAPCVERSIKQRHSIIAAKAGAIIERLGPRRSSSERQRRASAQVIPTKSPASASGALGGRLEIRQRRLSAKKCLQLLMVVASRVQTIDASHTVLTRLARCSTNQIGLGPSLAASESTLPLRFWRRVMLYSLGVMAFLVSLVSMALCFSSSMLVTQMGSKGALGICLAAFVSTSSFCGVFVAHLQLDLLDLVFWSFDFLFCSIQFSIASGCLMAMLHWDFRCLAVGVWWVWFHFCLFLDALPPPQRKYLGFRKKFVLPVVLAVLFGLVYMTYLLVFTDASQTLPSKTILRFHLGKHPVEMTTRDLLLNRLVMVFLWGLRLAKDVAWCSEVELIFIRGDLEYFTPLEMFPAHPESTALGLVRGATMPPIPSLQRGHSKSALL